MLPNPPHRLCKYPKTARLVLQILAAPILPINVLSSTAVDAGKWDFHHDLNTLMISEGEVPESIIRDIYLRTSYSVNDWLLAVSRSQTIDSHLLESIESLRAQLLDISNAGLNDMAIHETTLDQFLNLKNNSLYRIKDQITRSALGSEKILGISLNDGINSCIQYAIEINNQLKLEHHQNQQRDRGHHG